MKYPTKKKTITSAGISINTSDITLKIVATGGPQPQFTASKQLSLEQYSLREALSIIKNTLSKYTKRTVAGISSKLIKTHTIATTNNLSALEIDTIIKQSSNTFFGMPYHDINYDFKISTDKKSILLNAVRKDTIESIVQAFQLADTPLYAIESDVTGLIRAANYFCNNQDHYAIAKKTDGSVLICVGYNDNLLFYKNIDLKKITQTLQLYLSQTQSTPLTCVFASESDKKLIHELENTVEVPINTIEKHYTPLATFGHCLYGR